MLTSPEVSALSGNPLKVCGPRTLVEERAISLDPRQEKTCFGVVAGGEAPAA